MQTQARERFLQIVVAQLADEKFGRRVVAVDNHRFQELAVGVDHAQRRKFEGAGAAPPVAALERDRRAQGQSAVLDRLERRAKNRKFDEAGAGEYEVAVIGGYLAAS